MVVARAVKAGWGRVLVPWLIGMMGSVCLISAESAFT